MRSLLLFVAVSIPGVAAAASAAPDSGWFQRQTQALYDALTVGDPKPWGQALADDCLYTSEDGQVQSKTELVKSLRPLPKGFTGGIKVVDFQLRHAGDAVVAHYIADEWEDVFGQHLHTRYVSTDTWAPRGGAWRIVATQTTVVPRDEDPVPVDPKAFAAVLGTYSFDPAKQRVYKVFLRGGKLYGGGDEKSATQLIPLSPRVYFQAGSIHTMIFVADIQGVVTEMREIHKYNELTYQRVAGPR